MMSQGDATVAQRIREEQDRDVMLSQGHPAALFGAVLFPLPRDFPWNLGPILSPLHLLSGAPSQPLEQLQRGGGNYLH